MFIPPVYIYIYIYMYIYISCHRYNDQPKDYRTDESDLYSLWAGKCDWSICTYTGHCPCAAEGTTKLRSWKCCIHNHIYI